MYTTVLSGVFAVLGVATLLIAGFADWPAERAYVATAVSAGAFAAALFVPVLERLTFRPYESEELS